jgi:negative regulator of flagellin synthesis FlgM
MSYTNGIGNLQQVLSSLTPAATTPASQAGEAAKAPKAHHAASAPAQQADQTNLSSTSGVIAHALEGSDVRMEKVASLQQAIASGSYSVSSSDVAGKMIDSLLK